MSFDLTVFYTLNALVGQGVFQNEVIIFFATYVPYILIFVFVAYLFGKKRLSLKEKILGISAAFVAAITARLLFGSTIRYFFPRPRPFLVHDVHQIIFINAPSFPSGHALFLFAFSTVVYFYNKTLGLIFFLAAIVVCLARVAAGVHYPSDILVGALLGIGTGIVIMQYVVPQVRRSAFWKKLIV